MPADRRARLFRPATSSTVGEESLAASVLLTREEQVTAENVKVVMAIQTNHRGMGCAVYQAETHRLLLLQDSPAPESSSMHHTFLGVHPASSPDPDQEQKRCSADRDFISSCGLPLGPIRAWLCCEND